MSDTLDGIARWKRIADEIRAMIALLPPLERGDDPHRLPPEAELARQFGANRHTVRRAISSLSAEGLVWAERGRGTFVRPGPGRLLYPIGAQTRFTENISKSSRHPAGRLIGAETEAARHDTAASLKVPIGTPVIRLEALHVVDGIPLSIGTSWFVEARVPRIVAVYAETGSITKALAAHGIHDYFRKQTKVMAEHVSHADACHLGCSVNTIALTSQSVNYDPAGVPVQLSRSRFLADRVELVFDA